MRIKIQTTNDGDLHDWVRVYTNGNLLIEGRSITLYQLCAALAERYPRSIDLEPLIARGYVEEEELAFERA